jgi:hypothetical protein
MYGTSIYGVYILIRFGPTLYIYYIQHFWQGDHQNYDHIQSIYMVLANPNNYPQASCDSRRKQNRTAPALDLPVLMQYKIKGVRHCGANILLFL